MQWKETFRLKIEYRKEEDTRIVSFLRLTITFFFLLFEKMNRVQFCLRELHFVHMTVTYSYFMV
jgi:hypothetical protein